MDRSDVLRVYDDAYADAYDSRFLLASWPKHGAEFELALLRDLLSGPDVRWLDAGCGTGWFLSQFPGVERAGLDLSAAMLRQAEQANPDAIFLRQGDFADDVAEFHEAWSLVSCMWMAYCYLESMAEVERLVANMVAWTRPGGSIFIPAVADLEDLRPHTQVDYEEWPDVWGGRIAITGYYWTWEEPTGVLQENMMAVHVGHFVRLLEPYFERVEVIRYPLFEPGFVSRKAVVAKRRRPAGETGTAEVIWHPIPRHPDEPVPEPPPLPAPGDAAMGEALAAIHGQLGALRGEVSTLAASVVPPTPGPVALSSVSTRRVVRECVHRLNPFHRSLWRGAQRRFNRSR